MRTMPLMRRRAPLGLVVSATLLLAATTGQAQVETPAPASPPSSDVPGAPPLQEIPPSAPAGAPAPTLTQEPAPPSPPLALDQPSTASSATDAARPRPFYRKLWFWGAVGVVVATAAIILIATHGGQDTPSTTFGDMHAF
jgi:hypothetical protein